MALHDYQLEMAIKWATTLIRNGYDFEEAFTTASEWYSVDSETLRKIIIQGMEVFNADND